MRSLQAGFNADMCQGRPEQRREGMDEAGVQPLFRVSLCGAGLRHARDFRTASCL